MIKIPVYDVYPELVGAMRALGDAPAVSSFDRRGKITTVSYAALAENALALRDCLVSRGLSGSNVAVVGENSSLWIAAFLGAVCAGCVAVCVDIEQPDQIIRELIRETDCRAVLTSPSFADICAGTEGDGSAETILTVDAELLAGLPRGAEAGPSVSPDDTAAIVFTSGTTSKAKPVMLTHAGMLHNSSSGLGMVDLHKKLFSSLPFYHSYGLTCAVTASLILGARLFINGDLRTMLRDLQLASAETAIAVPLMAEAIYSTLWATLRKNGDEERIKRAIRIGRVKDVFGLGGWRNELKKIKRSVFGDLNLMIVGGAHLNPEITEGLRDFGILALPGYGITECSPLVSVNTVERRDFASVGLALSCCEVKLDAGEILVRGINVMKGYYNAPEETAAAFDGEWFRTGDLGEYDRGGLLYIVGRKKNLIVLKNGKKISPEKLEELVCALPMVKEAVVYGALSGDSADDVKPAVSVFPDRERSAGMSNYEILEELHEGINGINAGLPLYQQIQMVTIREKPFERNAAKKIIRDRV